MAGREGRIIIGVLCHNCPHMASGKNDREKTQGNRDPLWAFSRPGNLPSREAPAKGWTRDVGMALPKCAPVRHVFQDEGPLDIPGPTLVHQNGSAVVFAPSDGTGGSIAGWKRLSPGGHDWNWVIAAFLTLIRPRQRPRNFLKGLTCRWCVTLQVIGNKRTESIGCTVQSIQHEHKQHRIMKIKHMLALLAVTLGTAFSSSVYASPPGKGIRFGGPAIKQSGTPKAHCGTGEKSTEKPIKRAGPPGKGHVISR